MQEALFPIKIGRQELMKPVQVQVYKFMTRVESIKQNQVWFLVEVLELSFSRENLNYKNTIL